MRYTEQWLTKTVKGWQPTKESGYAPGKRLIMAAEHTGLGYEMTARDGKERYRLVHVASGKVLTMKTAAKSLEIARVWLELVADLEDWAQPAPAISAASKHIGGLRPLVELALEEASGQVKEGALDKAVKARMLASMQRSEPA